MTERIIIPSILEKDFGEFAKKLKSLDAVAPIVQIDIMDGKFVADSSFAGLQRINKLQSPAKFEIHLMVKHPLLWLEKIKLIKNVSRVIFHIESEDNPQECIDAIIKNGWEAGIALKAETNLKKVAPYYDIIDVVLFMLVVPGQQGGKLIMSLKDKIREFVKIKDRPLCATDGGLNEKNIIEVKNWGVEIFGIGSAIAKAENPAEEYYKFTSLIKN